jgi:hypothetical protein
VQLPLVFSMPAGSERPAGFFSTGARSMKQIFNREVRSPLHGDFLRGAEVPASADPAWVEELLKAGVISDLPNREAEPAEPNRMADVQAAQAATATPVAGATRTGSAPQGPKRSAKK